MANYKNTKGFNIQYLDSDPPNPIEGQMWYNSTSNTLKGAVVGGASAGTWASGGNLNTARSNGGSFGIQTDTIFGGGDTAPTRVAITEKYDGTSWTEVNDLNQLRGTMNGAGTSSSAGLVFGGITPPGVTPRNRTETESWDGTNWTEVNDLNTGRYGNSGFGTSTAAICVGGDTGSFTGATESWNGTSWTEVNDLNTTRAYSVASGISTSGIYSTGYNPPTFYTNVETWNGTSWTETTDVNTARRSLGASGSSSTNQLIFKGNIAPGPNVAQTESWNGTSWTEVNDTSVASYYIEGTGSSNTSALAFGGGPPYTSSTEEWTAPDILTKTFTVS